MASFSKDALRTPFGRNQFLRSTRDVKTESYSVAKGSVPGITIDTTTQKVFQPGVVMARILTGADAGKIGPYQGGGAVNESVSIAVDAAGGTFTITFEGATTGAIPFNAPAGQVKQALIDASNSLGTYDVVVTGGPGAAGGATPYVIEFAGAYGARNVPAVTTTATSLTGGAGTAAVTTTAGTAAPTGGATDGRGDAQNIVGINNTFLPWQLLERDVEIAVVYEAAVVQAWCLELNAAGSAYVALSNATADAIRNSRICQILFK